MNKRNGENGLAHWKLNSLKPRLLNCRGALGGIFSRRNGGSSSLLLFFELFVVLSLSVSYFFLVRNYITLGDPMNRFVFTAGSEKLYSLDLPTINDAWKGRLSGLLLSGALVDFAVRQHTDTTEQIERLKNVFGLYHAFWLLLLFVTIIFALRHSLLINLGIFAGLVYNFSPAAGPYFYPWDFPATLFFTLAVLFFERRQMTLMAAAICVGCFFKETVLACAVLALFAGHWKRWKRVLLFAALVVVYVAGKNFLLNQLSLNAVSFSMGYASNFVELFRPTILIYNLKVLFSATVNHVIFANAGTLVAVLVLGWRKRFFPYMTLIIVFLGGQLMYGGFNEFRIFMDILPLSLILLSERWLEQAGPVPAGEPSAGFTQAWAVRETFPVLIPMIIVLIGLCTSVVAWQYHIIFEELQPGRHAQTELGKFAITLAGDVNDVAVETQLLRSQYVKDELELAQVSVAKWHFSDAIIHYRRVLELDTNSVIALNNLAWMLATASDPGLRNGKEAVRLAERACQLTQNKKAAPGYTLAAAYAEAGRFADAVSTAQKAREVALEQGQNEIVARNEPLLELYKSGRAYHQEAKPATQNAPDAATRSGAP